MKLFIHKLTHWEYWPYKIIYTPIYFQWAYYALKSKTIFFFNASNPCMKNGGFFNESKKEIYNLIPQQYYPKSELILEHLSVEEILPIIEKVGIQFPFIAKPDIGLRGSAVKKIHNKQELKNYTQKATFNYILQDLIPYTNEIGVFYIRHPKEKIGRITGIVSKEFLTIQGDGVSTIEALLKKNPRFHIQLRTLKKEYKDKLQQVVATGESLNLVPYGNHCRGAKFTDISYKITPEMNRMIDKICLQIPGFYFGRLDIMYNTMEEFEQGKKFSIVELNGAASEPTHIYDPSHSLFFAWKELIKHIRYLYIISTANNEAGIPFLNHKDGMKQYRFHKMHNDKIINF